MMVTLANQVTHRSMWWDMLANQLFILSSCGTKTGKPRWVNLIRKYRIESSFHSHLKFGHLLQCCHSARSPMAESQNLFVSAMDSATSGMNALRAEWHSGIDENNFSGVSNWVAIFWINDGYMGKTSNPALNVMGYARKPTIHPIFVKHIER